MTRQARRVLGEPCKLWVRASAGENPGIAFCEITPTLALERPGYYSRSTALETGADDLVNEVDKLFWKSNCDLLAHPIMVAKR